MAMGGDIVVRPRALILLKSVRTSARVWATAWRWQLGVAASRTVRAVEEPEEPIAALRKATRVCNILYHDLIPTMVVFTVPELNASCLRRETSRYYELDRATNWGWSFLMAMFVVGSGYIGGGVLVGKRGTGSGLHRHPHARHWREIEGLVTDGVQFAKGKSRGARVPTTSRPGQIIDNTEPLMSGTGRTSRTSGKLRTARPKAAKPGSNSTKRGHKKKGTPRESVDSSSTADSVVASETGSGSVQVVGRAGLEEQRVHDSMLHESQAKIRVIGLNG